MVRITAVSRSVASVLEAVGDLSYAWEILGDYVAVLHARVRAEPRTAVLLRATFLKLASILDVPLVRISVGINHWSRPAWDIFKPLYLAQIELVFHDS